MGVNTKYKDSVFSFLFSSPETLRELYSALEGVTLPPDVPVTINTLKNVLFMDMVNDISFEIGGKLVILIEHQSTINPNMALRLLMYIARVYEKIVKGKNIYATKPVPLPRPGFYVLYNGTAPYPAERTLKLSDAFESGAVLGVPEEGRPALELEVKVLNINEGMNAGIAGKSRTLAGYSAFVARIRGNEQEGMGREEAVKGAVDYCREHGILEQFLERNAVEVISMLMTEWNWDDALAVRYEEGREEGLEEGREEGREEGLERGLEESARRALAEGASVEFVQKITGLDEERIKALQGE